MADLTTEEQAHVRAALRFLRARCGGWKLAAKAIRADHKTLMRVANGQTVSASTAIRVARFAGVGVDELLTGKFPPAGTCPHCGQHLPGASPTPSDAAPS